MNWPLALGTLVALGAGWLLARPVLRPLLAGMPPRRRGLIIAGLLVAVAIAMFSIRLAPFGVVALVMAGGAGARALTGGSLSEGLSEDDAATGPLPSGMTRVEALSVLGLDADADTVAIDAAHKRMILRAHPDQGGSDYLAAKVNEARSVLKR